MLSIREGGYHSEIQSFLDALEQEAVCKYEEDDEMLSQRRGVENVIHKQILQSIERLCDIPDLDLNRDVQLLVNPILNETVSKTIDIWDLSLEKMVSWQTHVKLARMQRDSIINPYIEKNCPDFDSKTVFSATIGLNLFRSIRDQMKEDLRELNPEALTMLEQEGKTTLEDLAHLIREIRDRDLQSVWKRIYVKLPKFSLPDVEASAEVIRAWFANSHLNKILELDLSHLDLQEVPLEIKYFPKLKSLNLSGNQIKTIRFDAFHRLDHLKCLNLSRNGIRELSEGIFHFMTSLEKLDLSENQIENLSPTVFQDLKSVYMLCLKNNRIDHLPGEVFRPLVNLEQLDLSRNAIQEIPEELIRELSFLWLLNLSHNQISDLPRGLFKNLDRKWRFHRGHFTVLSQLCEINFSHNRITEIPEKYFVPLKFLSKIDLSYNLIFQLPEECFSNIKTLDEVNLHGNPMQNLGC